MREISDLLDIDPGNLSRYLKPMTDMGLFLFSEKGRLKLFSINKKHPLYKEIRGLILKTGGAHILIKESLNKIKGIERAFIYGSFASDSADSQSDIDLMIIGNISSLKLASVLKPVEKRVGREIHFRLMDFAEFEDRLNKNDPFLKSVVKGKTINLVGGR
ncbi:MAG: nucleotidyltransferase domain-containing protein [Deltaproteobacteria bacterium]|nr:nucleotidyltransferase domain-containing protein [Deltaproteobacteria bacterium]